MQHGEDRDPFAEAEEQEVLREREAKRRNIAMLRQMAPSQVCKGAACMHSHPNGRHAIAIWHDGTFIVRTKDHCAS